MAHMGLTEAEWQVMECLWMSAPRTGREIIDALGKTTGWSRSTTLTLLRRLEDKGAVSAVSEGGMKHYRPQVAVRTRRCRRRSTCWSECIKAASV